MPVNRSPTVPVTRSSHCVKCSQPDDGDMVKCRECKAHYHRSCLGEVPVFGAFGSVISSEHCVICVANEKNRPPAPMEQQIEEEVLQNLRNASISDPPPDNATGNTQSATGTQAKTSTPTNPSDAAPNSGATRKNIFAKGAQPHAKTDPPIRTRTLFEDDGKATVQELKEQLEKSMRMNDALQKEMETLRAMSVNRNEPPAAPTGPQRVRIRPSGLSTPAVRSDERANERPHASGDVTTTENTLTPQHIAARKSMDTKLPLFDGNPATWPLFISFYDQSNIACNFSNQENLLRLINALQGSAREHVASLLSLPQCVPKVIERLKSRFGRPDSIIQNQLETIRKLPDPNTRNIQTIVKFADAVHNAVATMEAGGLAAYLTCPPLIAELAQRLPTDLRIQWAVFSRSFPELDLLIFDEWLDGLVSDICRVTPFPEEPKKRDPKRVHVTQVKTEAAGGRNRRKKSVPNTPKKEQQKSADVNRPAPSPTLNANSPSFVPPRDGAPVTAQFSAAQHQPSGNPSHPRPSIHQNWQLGNPRQSQFGYPHHAHTCTQDSVLFRILPVMLTNGNKNIKTFAFIDSGSSISLIDDKIARELQLTGPEENLCLEWTNGQTRTEKNSRITSLFIANPYNCRQKFRLKDVRTVVNLGLPKQGLDAVQLKERFRHLRTLPLTSYEDIQPMLLIGADNVAVGVPLKVREGCEGEPVALKCRLGWSLMGQIPSDNAPPSPITRQEADWRTSKPSVVGCQRNVNVHACTCNHLDDVGIIRKPEALYSADEIRARELLEKFTKRKDGHFETGLLWKLDDVTLPDNKPMAIRRLNCLKRRLDADPIMAEQLHAQIDEMEAEGYIRELSPEEESSRSARTWYLPVFPVKNPSKPDKIRLVWDAAAEFRGVSLNKMLLVGPDAVPPLIQPLNRFRERKVAINGDIRKMFHQVRVRQEDQDSQRFMWLTKNGEQKTFVMQVMTFGAASSPATAQYVKNLNAKEFEEDFPRAVQSIVQNHYVDDLMDSCDTVAEGVKLAQEVRFIHSQGGFEIRGWRSNRREVATELEADVNLDPDNGSDKVLGVWWRPQKDVLTYSLKYTKIDRELLNLTRKPTKREVLSLQASLFDPNGQISHFVVQLRILLQESWRARQQWDDEISDKQFVAWCHWIRQLPKVEKLEIRRCYLSSIDSYDDANVQLHVFVDAGEEAYVAVAYLRISKHQLIDVAQVGAKSKVAPLNSDSVPRLELSAALIGARYAEAIKGFLSIHIDAVHFWSDSTTVLRWLRNHRRYKAFVAFRVAEIREISNIEDWHYIPTDENVADEATKKFEEVDLDPLGPWFTGPNFLYEDESEWPAEEPPNCNSPDEEVLDNTKSAPPSSIKRQKADWCTSKPSVVGCQRIDDKKAVLTVAVTKKVTPFIEYTRFSNYHRLVRATAYVFRYIDTLKAKTGPNAAPLTASELYHAQMKLIGLAQREYYASEMQLMIDGKLAYTDPKFQRLCPFLDDDNILRLDSRLVNAQLSAEQRYPILLPPHHYITRLIIQREHEKCQHQFHETVLNNLLVTFFIPNARRIVKGVVKLCQKCRISNATPRVPRMGPLPVARLDAFTPPFTHTGLDYFGPFYVSIGRRTEKRYGCIFTCMTIRAIHIEIAHTLSTESFLMCLKNFLHRRGNVQFLYSDRGTNFIGAEKALREALKHVDERPMQEVCTAKGIQWHFNPPNAPNMGGCWERLIQSIKRALYAALPDKNPSDEALKTALIEVESLINARPLTYIPINDATAPALTPNDFLGVRKPQPQPVELDDSPTALKKSLETSQLITKKFWKRWISEYLPELTRRSKWFQDVPELKVGDLVVIVDANAQRGDWPRGIVEKTNVSGDNKVRSVEIRTNKGVYVRPVSKCARLDIETSWRDPLGGSVDTRGRRDRAETRKSTLDTCVGECAA